jgi:carbon-monoxide dehydrogenase iron sulfur subunit
MRKILINIEKCLGCRTCEIACAVEHSDSRDLHKAVLEKKKPRYRIFVLNAGGRPFPLSCRQCLEPQCLVACKSGGISLDEQIGIVIFERKRCVGCLMCVMNCPFGGIVSEHTGGYVEKCDLCTGREIPACLEACPCKAITLLNVEEDLIGINDR